jgi:hypothetical protein
MISRIATTTAVTSSSLVSMSWKTSIESARNPAGPVTAIWSPSEPVPSCCRMALTSLISRWASALLNPWERSGSATTMALPSADGEGGGAGLPARNWAESLARSAAARARSAGVRPVARR